MDVPSARLFDFRDVVLSYYAQHGRFDLPWRQPAAGGEFDPYRIVVSEFMLQQTQVSRVLPKYAAFLARFPTLECLAGAPLGEVLVSWQGLGYNRRAKFLHALAGEVCARYGGQVPNDISQLVALPGIGPNMAGAVMAYAFDTPVAFVETNIRSVFIHHFFSGDTKVADRAILGLVRRTLPAGEAREWYWALMDYGTFLKKSVGNPARAAQAYVRQSTFAGSRRQVRGQVLRQLAAGDADLARLSQAIADNRLQAVLADLTAEGLIRCRPDGMFSLFS